MEMEAATPRVVLGRCLATTRDIVEISKRRPRSSSLLVFVKSAGLCNPAVVKDPGAADPSQFEHGLTHLMENRRATLFYRYLLPLGATANLVLGLLVLSGFQAAEWQRWLQIGVGALCCAIAGWLIAVGWSRAYWDRGMRRNVALWRRISDAIFNWVEEAPVPGESMTQLKASLDDALASAELEQN